MRMLMFNLAVAFAVAALTLASCQRPIDVDRETIYSRQAIDLMAEGQRYEKEGNYELALDRYGKALDLSPRPALYYHIGACYYALGQYAKAHEFLSRAVALAGDYPAAQYLLSKVRIQLALAARHGQRTPTPARPTPSVARRTPTPVRPVAPTKTPRVVARAKTPTPRAAERTPAVRPTPARTRTPVARTPTPTRTPVARTPRPTSRRPTPSPPTPRPTTTPARVGPVIVRTPPPSVEPIRTPRRAVARVTPRPGPSGSLPPPIDPSKIFRPLGETELQPSVGLSTAPAEISPLLGEWRFHWEQAQSFYQRRLFREAADELLLVLGKRPRHLEARLLLAKIYDENLDNEEKALEQYEMARVLFPSEPKPFFYTGNFYLRRAMKNNNANYYDRARTYYYQAIKVKPDYYQAYHNLAITFMKQGNFEAARKWFEATLKIKPDYAKAHRNYGLLLEENLNDPKGAIRHYRQYLRLAPDAPDAGEVRNWIEALQGL